VQVVASAGQWAAATAGAVVLVAALRPVVRRVPAWAPAVVSVAGVIVAEAAT
jgi:hypothetical protein